MTRGLSPAVAAPLLVAITVALAAVVGATAFGVVPALGAPDPVALSVTATAATGEIELVHAGGPPVDVREVTVRIAVDGTPLDHQPPVPFFAATGFNAGPTGPFNAAADPIWTAGERATLRVADTNAPPLDPGTTITVRLYRDGTAIAVAETRVR